MEQTRDIMTIVGNNVKRYREEAGYSQSYLGGLFWYGQQPDQDD